MWTYRLHHGFGISFVIDLYYNGRYSYVSSTLICMKPYYVPELMDPFIAELNAGNRMPDYFPLRRHW